MTYVMSAYGREPAGGAVVLPVGGAGRGGAVLGGGAVLAEVGGGGRVGGAVRGVEALHAAGP